MKPSSTIELLTYLRDRNVEISADHDRLRFKAPAGAVDSELREELVLRKAEILDFLRQASAATLAPIGRIPRDGELPLSFSQARLWLLDQLEPGGTAYNIPMFFQLKGNFSLSVFEQSLSELVRRHEVLRTYFVTLDGQPIQRIAPPEPVRVPVVDLQSLTENEKMKEAERLAVASASRPFDFGKAPMLRATLLKCASDEHLLLIEIHHIAFDGWSLGIFVRELTLLYNAFLIGGASPLPELSIQYADFAAWQRDWLQGDILKEQLDYWRNRLSGTLPVLELPTDRARPPVQTYRGGNVRFALSRELIHALNRLSRQEGTTIFVTLLAAFKTLLLRYTGQEDILVGTPTANRNRADIEGLIGFFINTLVMRTDVSGNPTFRTLLHRVQETALGAQAHQDLPFEKLVEEVHSKRDFSRSPIFQILFSLLNTRMEPLELHGLEPAVLQFQDGGAKYDLSLNLEESEHGLEGGWSYNTDLFDKTTIERMAGHFRTLLEGIVSEPDARLHDFPLLTAEERQQLLLDWNQTEANYPAERCIQELFEIEAKRTPGAIAVECGGEHLTYRELDARGNQLAERLQVLGVGPGVLVAVCMDRTLDLPIALLGILKSGGAYVPLDPSFPSERLRFMLEDAKPRVLITQTILMDRLPPDQNSVICLDRFSWTGNPSSIGQRSKPSDLAYVLYTSGSSGQPKGVEICHRSVVNFLSAMQSKPGLEARDILLSVTTPSFDIFGLELWLPLISGAKVVLVPPEASKDGTRLASAIASSGATVMQATPSTWRLLLDSGWQGNPKLKVLCGGEPWSKDLAARLLPKCDSLWNMYGPTETTIWSAVYPVNDEASVFVGPPIANTTFYVVDSNLQPQPVGLPGELLIGGDGLARGYLNRPALTAEKFIADPFSADPESRLYRTGDLVRRRPDGAIEFLSRIDQQVKLRGFRIELGEIESVLMTHPSVKEAVVIIREDRGEPELVSYVVSGAIPLAAGASELRQFLKQKLPDYMIPTAFVFLETLPLTPNRKVDRKALPAPDQQTIQRPESPAAEPRDQLERELTALWEKVLRVHPVRPTDNFFDLGGHSFAAVRLLAGIQELTGTTLPLAILFQAATVESLAEILRKDAPAPSWSSLVPISPSGSRRPLFLVHGAEGNLLLYRQLVKHLGSDQPVYGLQSQGLNGSSPFHRTIQEMGSHYVREIMAVQPHGPYVLGGYCLGGIIAFEMAQQLTAQGEKVELVVMLDTYNTSAASREQLNRLRFLHVLQNAWFHCANIAILRAKDRWKFLKEKMDIARTRLHIRLRAASQIIQQRRAGDQPTTYRQLLVRQVNDQAALDYVPAPYHGRVAVIRPQKHFWGLASPTLGWNTVVRENLEMHELKVYTKGMLIEPFCRSLADTVRKCLNKESTL